MNKALVRYIQKVAWFKMRASNTWYFNLVCIE